MDYLKNLQDINFQKLKIFINLNQIISFDDKNIIFFDNKGSILNFDEKSKLIWKKNYYSKSEKKLKPILQFANDGKILVVADNIAKYYALDLKMENLNGLKII